MTVGVIVGFVLVVALIAAVAVHFLGVSKEAETEEKKGGKNHMPDPQDELKETIDGLVNLNLYVRVENFSTELVTRIEKLIDSLRTVLPLLYEEFVSFQLTWETKRMATEYLPKLCDRFGRLSDEERQKHAGEFEENLNTIASAVEKIEGLAKQKETTEFNTMSDFLRVKFASGVR